MTIRQSGKQGEAKREAGSYPYLPLTSALKVADAVKELGGARSDIPKSALAKHLGESERSPAFSQKLTSAKTFGLVYGRREYGLTELAKRYYFPASESDKSAALLEIFSSPTTFKELVRRFDGGELPKRGIVANILHRELAVPESWKDRVAAFFYSSAQHVGAVDDQGFLRHKAAFHKSPPPPTQAANEATHRDQSKARVRFFGGDSPIPSDVNVWSFSHGGKAVRLETPADLDKQLWQKLNAYVQLLKPIGIDMS